MVLCPKHKVLLEKINCLKFKGLHVPAFVCPFGEIYFYTEIYGIDGLRNYYASYGEELTKSDLDLLEKYYKVWLEKRLTEPKEYYVEIEKELTPEELMKLVKKTPENILLISLMARIEVLENVVIRIEKAISDILKRLR